MKTIYNDEIIYIDPRNKNLGAKIISRIENTENLLKKLNLKKVDQEKYYEKSFNLGIPQVNLGKLKDKIFGIENNLDELGGIDFQTQITATDDLGSLPFELIFGTHPNATVGYDNGLDVYAPPPPPPPAWDAALFNMEVSDRFFEDYRPTPQNASDNV